jgi:SpoIIAA-like
MVERAEGLPAGVLGFRLSGKLSRDEYQDELMQPIYAALERGEQLNLYFVFADDFSGLDAGALWEDVKAAGEIGLKHRSAWGRMALVTDKDWIRHGVSAFGWLSPGELRVFTLEEQTAARSWVASPAA